jgi:DNA-binding MarR family transcriptional regulator
MNATKEDWRMEQAEKEKLLVALHSLKKSQTWFSSIGGISRGEYFLLHRIFHLAENAEENNPGAKITDLSKAVQMSRPAISQMLNSLEKKGYIERIMAKSDRRVVYVKLTETGSEQLAKNQQQFHFLFNQIVEELGSQDTAELVRLVYKLNTIIEGLQIDR